MSRLFANGYDYFMRPLEKRKFKQIRRELIAKAHGQVLEIGAGTGVNFPFYQHVEKVTAIEPNPYMIDNSQSKQNEATIPIELIQATAENLPFPDNTFDTVVATLVFCTIPDPETAILEIIRVCKPSARVLFFEHVKMDNKFLAVLQECLTPGWKKICDGCCLNRDTLGLIKSHHLKIVKVNNYYNGLFISVEAVK